MKSKVFALVLFSLVFVGCATYATGPLFQQASPAPETKGTLYVFRAKTISVPNVTVKIDGRPFVVLTVMGYSYAYLSPGIHRLNFNSGSFGGSFISEVEIKEGEALYVEHHGDGYGTRISEIPSSQALEAVKDYRYVEPINRNF